MLTRASRHVPNTQAGPAWPAALVAGLLGLALVAGQAAAAPGMAAPSVADEKSGSRTCTDALKERHKLDFIVDTNDVICFDAYLSRFSPWEAKTMEARGAWGIPQWTIHKVEKLKRGQAVPEGNERPPGWFTVPSLKDKGMAPTDANYAFSKHFRGTHPNWYERGHMTQKYLAERVKPTGTDSDKGGGWFTHNLVNAVPQRAAFNKGPWLTLECYTGAWANQYGEVWIITGPVFLWSAPTAWLKSDAARTPFPIAIPDALFKIVVRKDEDGAWDALAFLYLQEHGNYTAQTAWSPADWLVPITRIEQLTGLVFSPELKPSGRKRERVGRIWPVSRIHFDPSCKRFAAEVP